MGGTFVVDWKLFAVIMFALFCFGWAFNAVVDALGERLKGYTALLVVAGVLVTIGAMAIISWQAAVIALAFFAASGIPMIFGDIYRTVAKREKAIRIAQMIAEAQVKDLPHE